MKTGMFLKGSLAAILIFSSIILNSQTLEDAQKAYNAAVYANNQGQLPEAVAQFDICLETCTKLVKEKENKAAAELMVAVRGILPKLYLQLGSELLKQEKTGEGLTTIYLAKDAAQKYGDKEIEDTADKLIPQIHYKIAASLFKTEKLNDALVHCDKAIAINADFASAYLIKTAIFKKKNNDVAFKSTAQAGIEVCKRINDTKTQETITDMAYRFYLTKGLESKGNLNYEEAIGFLNSSLEFRQNDATAFYLLALIYNATEKYSDAIATGQKALEFEKGNDETKAKIYMLIAEAYAKNGDISSACTTYKKAAVGIYLEIANYQIVQVLKCK
jgi:tetratricopeptide (TPR) repeat protein